MPERHHPLGCPAARRARPRTASVILSLAATVTTMLGPRAAAAQAPPGAAPDVRLQSFSVIVPDYDQAKRWYTETLGFIAVIDQSFGNAERFILVAPPGQRDVGIVLQKARVSPDAAEPGMTTDYSDRIGKTVNVVIRTSDVTAYAELLRARGVELTSPPTQRAWGGQATFRDLYGNTFVIVGPLQASR